MNFVSLFSGAGGLDLGLEEAGWDCRYASDIDANAVATMRANQGMALRERMGKAFKSTFIEQADVRELNSSAIFEKSELHKGEVTLLAGGPPCQSWSSAGHQLGLQDPRGQLFGDFVRIANELDTRWILFENVRGLLTARGSDNKPGSALELIRQRLFDAGFQTSVSLLNAADFGAPQRRVRLFIIGYRGGDAPPFPAPSHTKNPDLEGAGKLPWITLGECLGDLDRLTPSEIIRPAGKIAKELKGIRPGTGVKSPGKKETTRPGGHWGYKQGAFVADLDQAARTITASGQQDWIRDPQHGLRRLCPRECAAIQTFPESWEWTGSRAAQYKLIGNAVPTKLAQAIGRALHQSAKASPKLEICRTGSLLPLPGQLQAAITYTMKEERANGESRRLSPVRRRSRIELAFDVAQN